MEMTFFGGRCAVGSLSWWLGPNTGRVSLTMHPDLWREGGEGGVTQSAFGDETGKVLWLPPTDYQTAAIADRFILVSACVLLLYALNVRRAAGTR